MALRNYMYAKHDANVLISSRISGNPMKEPTSVVNIADNLKKLNVGVEASSTPSSSSHCASSGECRKCPDCPRTVGRSKDMAKVEVETEAGASDETAPRSGLEIDYNSLDF